jgi:hypothetical protein
MEIIANMLFYWGLTALLLELNIGKIIPSYGKFRWERFWAYVWLTWAITGIGKHILEKTISVEFLSIF